MYAVFICISLISLIWSRLVYETSWYLALHCANLVVIFLATNVFTEERETTRVLPVLTVLSLIISLIGFLERLRLIEPFGAYAEGRIISSLGNAGYLGGVLAALIPVAITLAIMKSGSGGALRNVPVAVLAWIAGLAGVTALLMTGSRTGLIATAAGLSLLGLFALAGLRSAAKPRWRIRYLLILLLASSFVLIVGFVIFSPGFRAVLRPDIANSVSGIQSVLLGRVAAWKAAISIWLSQGVRSILFGRGMGSYYVLGFSFFPSDYQLEASAYSFKHAHNEYLELLAEGGILSLLVWLAMVLMAWLHAVRAGRNPTASVTQRAMARAMAAGMTAILVQNLADPFMRTSSAQALFFFFIGTAFVLPVTKDATVQVSSRWSKLVLVIGSSVLLGFALFHGYRFFRIESALLKGYMADNEQAASIGFDETLRLDPDNVYALYEKLTTLEQNPKDAIACAERIERVIPGFRQTALFKGFNLAMESRYEDAALSFRRYLSQESFNEAAWSHMVACEIMLGETDAAAASLGDYFRARHRYAMRWKDNWFDLEERELRINLSSDSNRVFQEEGTVIAELSAPYLGRIAGLLAARHGAGFVPLLEYIFVAMGGLFDELGYGDFSLASYDQAVSLGGMDQNSRNRILAMYMAYYEKARAALAAATTKGDRKLEARAKGFVMTYIGYIMKIAPTRELAMEYENLMTKEIPAR